MRLIWILLMILGLAVIALGILWFLQGSNLVRIDPVACGTQCEPIVGHQPAWQVAGIVAGMLGACVTTLSVRKLRR